MLEKQSHFINNEWWVNADMPARDTHRAAFLIDGRMTMLEMCHRFLSAKRSIYIAAWGLTPSMLMVRGKHHRAGPDGSPAQEELLAWLRSKGLEEQDLLFWQRSEALSVENVLGYVVAKGVEVRVLLWDFFSLPLQPGSEQIQKDLSARGVIALLDDSHKDLLNHPIASLHQKAIAIDSRYAFVGGIDLMTRGDGDFDRWDTKGHPYQNLLRHNNGKYSHCWHDVHLMFEGDAVADIEHNFRQRWNAVIDRKEGDATLIISPPEEEAMISELSETMCMQVVRTIPRKMYAFAEEDGIATILEAYQKAFAQAKRSIYIENQYFWRRTFLGLENPTFGLPHEDMETLFQALADALKRGVIVTLVLPDNPNVGRDFTDDGLQYLWEIAPEAVAAGTLQVYTLGSSLQHNDGTFYRPIYVHAKAAIVDDQWLTIGSANLNNRGMRDDAELNVALLNPSMARGLRILLMAEHLGLSDEDTLFRLIEVMGRSEPTEELERLSGDLGAQWERLQALLGDPFAAMALFVQQAKANLEAIKAQKPLTGHLLPYIRCSMQEEYGITVDAVNGWLDLLSHEHIAANELEQVIETHKDGIEGCI